MWRIRWRRKQQQQQQGWRKGSHDSVFSFSDLRSLTRTKMSTNTTAYRSLTRGHNVYSSGTGPSAVPESHGALKNRKQST